MNDPSTSPDPGRRSLLSAAMCAATTAGLLGISRASHASHRGTSPHIIDVVDHFGAKGDGTTPDAVPIQNAIDSLPVDRGGTIFFPAGVYNLGAQSLVLDGPKQLVGVGREATILKYTGPGAAILINRGTPVKTVGFVLRDLQLDGHGAGAVGLEIGQHQPVAELRPGSGLIENVVVRRFRDMGIRAISTIWLECLHASVLGNGVGIVLDSIDASFNNFNRFLGCDCRGSIRQGLIIREGISNVFFGCDFEGNGEEGVLIQPDRVVHQTVFEGCWFEKNNSRQSGTGHPHVRTEGRRQIHYLTIANCLFNNSGGFEEGEANPHIVLGGTVLGGQIGPNDHRQARRNDGEIPAGATVHCAIAAADPARWWVDPAAAAQILWMGGATPGAFTGVGIGTAHPPAPHHLVVGGTSRFATVGAGVIGRGVMAAVVTDDRVGPESHIMVTLNGDPGRFASVRYVKNRYADSPPGFTVVLNRPTRNDTAFTYFIVN